MKRTLALLALLAAPLYAQTTTIGDLPNASSVTATDDFACDQGAATRACTALQIKELVITYINSESKLEGVVADMDNIIQEAEIDTEAKLEAILSDVTDLLTNNDTITADAANADAIDAITEIAAALKTGLDLEIVTGTAGSTDDCAKWDANGDLVTAGAACGSGSGGATSESELEGDLTDVTDVYTDNDVDFIDSDDLANDDWGDISISNGSASIDDSTVGSPQIDNDSILAEDLYLDNVGVLDDIMTFSTTADNFAWQTPAELSIGLARQAATDCTAETGGLTDEQCHELDDNTLYICESGPCNGSGWVAYEGAGGTGAFSDASDPVLLNTPAKDVVIGTAQKNTSKLTVDGEEDVVQVTFQCHSTQTSNPECFVVESSTGTVLFSVEVDGTVNMSTSAAPTIALKDSDSIADPPDDNATISGNLTDTGDGTEDMDILIQQQVAGTPTDVLAANADGVGDDRIVFPDDSIGPDELLAAGQTNGYALTYATGDNWAWGEIGSGTPGGSTTQVQFNDASAFGGDAGLTFNKTTDVLTVGTSATGAIAGNSDSWVEIDDVLYITPVASPPIACTTNDGIIYHDDSGVICICDGASAWVEWVDYSGTGACS